MGPTGARDPGREPEVPEQKIVSVVSQAGRALFQDRDTRGHKDED